MIKPSLAAQPPKSGCSLQAAKEGSKEGSYNAQLRIALPPEPAYPGSRITITPPGADPAESQPAFLEPTPAQ